MLKKAFLLVISVSLNFVFLYGCNKSTNDLTPSSGTATTSTTTTTSSTYNDLWIPPTITGKTFDLTLAKSSKQLRTGAKTATYGYNGTEFWGPTLIMNKGDFVQMNVTNNLSETTTTHWHGFHIPAIMDGGPHQMIEPNTTWKPSFEIKNNAGTYWYHPHLHEKTFQQLTYGAGGLIIIKDPIESALALPRTYGTDDIPLVLTSRRYNSDNSFTTTEHAYGDYAMSNGTHNAQISLPKQFVRFRILNAETERAYNLGFSDNRSFYVITNDGGLLDAPVEVTRVKLAVGERAEILVDLSKDAVSTSLDMKAYNANQEFGFGGSEPQTNGQFGSLLNNKDFTVLHINVKAATVNAITSLPAKLTTNIYWKESDATSTRTIRITGGQAGSAFTFDNNTYGFTTINQTVKLNAVEKWTIVNNNIFGHSFHIHDIQFKIVSRSSGAIANYESGWKDTFYIRTGETVSVVAKYDDFASSTNPFMYHCHFPNHEDAGLMGQFLVTQ